MLDFYFASDCRKRQLRRGPLAAHLDGLAAELRRESYAMLTARRILSVAGQFSHYAGIAGIGIEALDEAFSDRFLADRLVTEGLFRDGRKAMQHLLRYLRKQNLIAQAVERATPHPYESTLAAYDGYLDRVRGLAPSTRYDHAVNARQFLDWLGQRYGTRALRRASAPDVLEYITDTLAHRRSRSARGHLCCEIRTFLRYLHTSGALQDDLTRAVPRVAHPRLASLPPRLAWPQVRMLIDSIDTSRPEGLRDKAIVLLLATVGLRAHEVQGLELGDIAWRAGEIRLPRTKTRRERIVPLLQEVGAALADYVLHGRPPLDVPQVMLRHMAPPGPITSSNGIVCIVRRHLRRARISVPRGGAHLLRHSLATRMVNAGVPIKSVADVLGHASINTTAIYTKVDTITLAAVALPFPGGAR